MEIFDALSSSGRHEVEEHGFIHELLMTGKFTHDETQNYIAEALDNGQIFRRKKGFFTKHKIKKNNKSTNRM
jgi:replicative DNA helicase Mcm